MSAWRLANLLMCSLLVSLVGAREIKRPKVEVASQILPHNLPPTVWNLMGHQLVQEEHAKSSAVSTHIVGGIEVTIADYPYQVSLRLSGSHICGGSLISPLWVVTAAHCTNRYVASKLSVQVGSTNVTSGGTVIAVALKVVHANFSSQTLYNDISLLKLKTAANVGAVGIATIALPSQNLVVADNTNCTTSGWGTTSPGGSAPVNLRAVSIPVLSQSSCQNSYKTSSIAPSMICAGFSEGGKDSCQGDSGGPLVAVIDDVKLLIGVVSWGESCALPMYPGVYTRVSSFRDWIKTKSGV